MRNSWAAGCKAAFSGIYKSLNNEQFQKGTRAINTPELPSEAFSVAHQPFQRYIGGGGG